MSIPIIVRLPARLPICALSLRTSCWPSILGSLALGAGWSVAIVSAQDVAPLSPPVVLPLDEVSACQQLASAWIETPAVALLVAGVLAVVGGFTVMHDVLCVMVGLGERVYARVWPQPVARSSGQGPARSERQD